MGVDFDVLEENLITRAMILLPFHDFRYPPYERQNAEKCIYLPDYCIDEAETAA